MADTPPRSDSNLLERLNALKPTSVSLDRVPISSQLSPRDADQPTEDALLARLRTLRNQPSGGEPNRRSTVGSQPLRPARTASDGDANAGKGADTNHDTDLLFPVDDDALDDLLEGIDLEANDTSTWTFDPAAESRKVFEALEKYSQDVRIGPAQGDPPGENQVDDTDSEGEAMSREVEKILSQARDEAAIGQEKEQDTPRKESSPDQPATPTAPGAEVHGEDPQPDAIENPGFSLPSVPSALRDPDPAEAVPGTDSPGQTRKSLDFENDITVRLAALKGLGSGINTDSFGLPSVPTFQPEDRPVPGVARKVGYTDEDQKTWCIVCLEDATVQCLGCDDDVYCARCWKDMHVGPAAGYDERGHKWVKFER